jgi:PAP2 superfamily
MTNLEWSWQEATISACGLVVVTVLLRLARRPRLTATAMFTQETALVLALFALWQFAGSFSVMGPAGALGRARWIWHLERVMHLPSETSVQRLVLPHPLIVQAFNLYYDVLHFPVLIACLIWLWIRHRTRYIRVRTTLVALTGACLLIQLIPVAPPRMLPGTGLVDTAVLYHQSVYAAHTGFEADQLSAMPSVHVGWAILVAIMVITAARSRWRWLALLYPAATTLAVVVTANHFWLDGIVAGLLLALVLLVQYAISRAAARYRYMRLHPYRPAWDHRGMSPRGDDPPSTPRRGASSAICNGDPAGTGGSNGRNGSAADRERTPARCDRPS